MTRRFRAGFFGFMLLVLVTQGWAQPIQTWKALVVAGSYTYDGAPIENWDNSRRAFVDLFQDAGFDVSNVRALSSNPDYVYTDEGGVLVEQASRYMVGASLEDLDLGPGDALFLFLTSHGARGGRFLLEWDRNGVLETEELDALLDRYVGDRPAVILVSACYSGAFLSQTGNIKGPNRVVLTASRDDRSSFGCGPGARTPEWDETVLRLLAQEDITSWSQFAARVEADIANKEQHYDVADRSLPQAYVPLAADKLLSSFFGREQ